MSSADSGSHNEASALLGGLQDWPAVETPIHDADRRRIRSQLAKSLPRVVPGAPSEARLLVGELAAARTPLRTALEAGPPRFWAQTPMATPWASTASAVITCKPRPQSFHAPTPPKPRIALGSRNDRLEPSMATYTRSCDAHCWAVASHIASVNAFGRTASLESNR